MKQVSVKKNYIYNTFYQILTLVTPLITAPYISRIFGAEGVGIQSYTNSIAMYFTMFAALGTASYGQREIAQHRNDKREYSKIFWEIQLLCIITTLVCTAIWIVFSFISEAYTPYYLVLTMTIIAVAFDVSWFFAGQEQFKFIVIRNTIIKILGIVLLFTCIKDSNDLLLYMALVAGTGLLGNVSMWSYLPKFLVKIDVCSLNIKRHIKETLVYFIPTIATSVYTILDKTMIGLFTTGSAENGYYEQTTKVVKMAQAVILSINTVMASRMSYLFSENRIGEVKEKIRKAMSFILLLGIPSVLGLIGIAENFVPWFFGDGYDPVIPLIYVYSPLIVIIGISNCLGSQYLTPSGQRARSSKGIIAGACVNAVLNLLLIPHLGAMGAAIGSVIAETVITVIYLYMSKEFMTFGIIIQESYKRLIAGGVMLAVIWGVGGVCGQGIVTTLIQILVGGGSYFVLLILLRDEFVKQYVLVKIQEIAKMILHNRGR